MITISLEQNKMMSYEAFNFFKEIYVGLLNLRGTLVVEISKLCDASMTLTYISLKTKFPLPQITTQLFRQYFLASLYFLKIKCFINQIFLGLSSQILFNCRLYSRGFWLGLAWLQDILDVFFFFFFFFFLNLEYK